MWNLMRWLEQYYVGLFMPLVLVICFVLLPSAAFSNDSVVVIPLGGDGELVVIPLMKDETNPSGNIIVVAEVGGDYNDPVVAMASIDGASETDPYIIKIEPGLYDIGSRQLVMKEYVSLVGSGIDATIIKGNVAYGYTTNYADEAIALVWGANNAVIRDLTIENRGRSDTYTLGLMNKNASPMLSNIKLIVSGVVTTGLSNIDSSAPILTNTVIAVSSTAHQNLDGYFTHQRGIFNWDSSPTLKGVMITLNAGSGQQHGIENVGALSSLSMSDSTISLIDGKGFQYGVYNDFEAKLNMSNSTVSVSGNNDFRYGVYSTNAASSVRIENSIISAARRSVRASNTTEPSRTLIIDSVLTGSVGGDARCSGTVLSDGTVLDNDCNPL